MDVSFIVVFFTHSTTLIQGCKFSDFGLLSDFLTLILLKIILEVSPSELHFT